MTTSFKDKLQICHFTVTVSYFIWCIVTYEEMSPSNSGIKSSFQFFTSRDVKLLYWPIIIGGVRLVWLAIYSLRFVFYDFRIPVLIPISFPSVILLEVLTRIKPGSSEKSQILFPTRSRILRFSRSKSFDILFPLDLLRMDLILVLHFKGKYMVRCTVI